MQVDQVVAVGQEDAPLVCKRRARRSKPPASVAVTVLASGPALSDCAPFSADHGAAAAFGFARLEIARFQHLRLGKLRFSLGE